MTDFTRVTDDFFVAHQLDAEDLKRAAAEGFTRIISNRPDGEAPGQMTIRDAGQTASDAGLSFYSLPFAGPPPAEMVDATVALLEEGDGPTLAFCRTGTRSITVWAYAQAKAGLRKPDELIALAREAGYDLAPHRPALERLASGA